MTGNLLGLKNGKIFPGKIITFRVKNVMVRSNVPSKTYTMGIATVLNEP